jgi:D-alanine transfer protein
LRSRPNCEGETAQLVIAMTERVTARSRAPHLISAVVAGVIPIVILCGGRLAAIHLERETIHRTAPKDLFLKNQGLALQRSAACTANILLLYGSSELIDPIPNRAPDFFSNAPTGFQVCPVGRPGTTSLVILQKIGALGSDLRDRKVAISLSASWFFRRAADPYAYAGNFSLPAASGLFFGTALDLDLKKEIARRMLQFPDTVAKNSLVQAAATCLASDRPLDRIGFIAIWPLGRLQNIVFDLQDHFEMLVYVLARIDSNPRLRLPFDYLRRARSEPTLPQTAKQDAPQPGPDADAAFRDRIADASEWGDLDLLFRVLTKVGAQPLVLSMPIDVTRLKARGVSSSARQTYYDKVSELAQRYHIQVVQFADHDADPSFLIARREHPTPKGWMYYNQALDNFFHDSL